MLACWFCISRKGGTGGGGWDHPQGAVNMAARLGFEKAMVGTGPGGPPHALTSWAGLLRGVKAWLRFSRARTEIVYAHRVWFCGFRNNDMT